MLTLERVKTGINNKLNKRLSLYKTPLGYYIDSRELHRVIGNKKKFADWIKYNTKNNIGFFYGWIYDDLNIEANELNEKQYDYFYYKIPATYNRGMSIEYLIDIDIAIKIVNSMKIPSIKFDRTPLLNYLYKLKEYIDNYIILEDYSNLNLMSINDTSAKCKSKIKEDNIEKINERIDILNKKIEAIENKTKEKDLIDKITELIEVIKSKEIQKDKQAIENNEKDNEEIDIELIINSEYAENLRRRNVILNKRITVLLEKTNKVKSIMDMFAIKDANRRGKYNPKLAKINAYKFRSNSIKNAGIKVITDKKKNKSFIECIKINDLDKALEVYVDSLKYALGVDMYLKCFSEEDKLYKLYKSNCDESEFNDIMTEICPKDIIKDNIIIEEHENIEIGEI